MGVTTQKLAFSIPEFCAMHNLSRTHLWMLEKEGKGPRLMHVGRRRLISAEAASDWRRSMEVPRETNQPEEG